MLVIQNLSQLRQYRELKGSIALVPTLGNLHEGHLSLVRHALDEGERVLVSIFVNPLQFGAGEDFERYPRTLEADFAKLESIGTDAVFTPDLSMLYPFRQTVLIRPSDLASDLCGVTRPGHFAGVATVVLKLFNLTRPEVALFGKKDYQQLFIIQEMVEQLNVPVRIVGIETVRDLDGLALSSRNSYLSVSERAEAPMLYATLQEVVQKISSGKDGYEMLCEAATRKMRDKGWQVEYVTIRDSGTLQLPEQGCNRLVILAAVWIGKTRLIDNIEFICD